MGSPTTGNGSATQPDSLDAVFDCLADGERRGIVGLAFDRAPTPSPERNWQRSSPPGGPRHRETT